MSTAAPAAASLDRMEPKALRRGSAQMMLGALAFIAIFVTGVVLTYRGLTERSRGG